jgi:hypothetical protein
MRYAHITLQLATAACAIAIATPAAAQAASTAAPAYSNSAAAAPTMRHSRRSLDTVQARIQPQRALGYGSMQAPISDRRPTQDGLQPSQDDLQNLDKDNQQLNLPATQDDIAGAGQVQSREDALTKKIEQDDPLLDSEIRDICPSCGGAEYAPDAPVHQHASSIDNGFNHQPTAPVHRRLSPIYNGFNHQPTADELRALDQQDLTRDQAQETDRLYDQLMSTTNQILRQHPAGAP